MNTISKLENRDDFYVEKHINIDNYVLQDKIGSGSFSKVFKVLDKQTGLICAAKISIQKIFEYTDDIMRNLTREINIISKINHPCVLSFIGFSLIGFKKSNNPVIITEYTSNGTLNDLIQLNLTDPIKSDLIFNDTRKLIIIYGIAAAMTYLHSNNIIHRDLKPENILINDIFLPKIADFGLSKFDCIQGQNNQTSIGEIKGTPKYISPEIWGKYQYTKAADVYAFGMIVFDIFSKENPFKNIQYYELIKKINEGFRPEINSSIPKPYKDLIMKCWSDEPNMRPTFDEIVDTLKNDRSFITEKVIEEDYLKYIDFIDHYNTSFDSSKFEINLDNSKIVKPKLIDERNLNIICQKDYIFDFFPYEKFSKLNKKCQKLVFESNNDQNKQFLIGKCLVEGSDDFPIDSEIGVMFLRSSIEKGSKESLIYYIKMLIKGDIIPKNVKKVKKLLKKYLDEQDPYYLLLYGKLLKKENKINEARNMFYQSAFLGNEDAMYEYSKLIINDKNKSILYCKKAIEKGCLKAIYKYGLILLNDENHYKEGIEYIKKAADEGLPKANYQYSQILEKENKEEYVYYLKKAAIKGYANAMYKYGLLLSKKEENKQESIQYLEKACDKNQLDAIYYYGLMLKNGIDVNENLNKAAKLIKISADNGNSDSMLLYAEMLSRGEGVFPDEEETIKYYKMAIDKDHIEAMYQYSHYLQHMSKCTNKEEIVKYYKMAADKGHLPALVKYIYTLGTTPEETEEKFKYLKIAIELGYDDAICSFCGRMRHAKRDGITDIEGKINYIKNLIEKGNVTAMDFFGRLLIFGEDFIINKKEAFNYFKMAIEHGNIKSVKKLQYCFDFNEIADDEQINYIIYLINTKKNEIAAYEYAEMLRYGRGVPVNKEEALKYYKIAADSGTPIYADDYASLLFNGEISEINKSEAFKYYKLAVDAAIEQRNYVQIDGNNFSIKCAADSCFSMLFYGDGITQNKPEALKYIKFLADRGYVQRMYDYSNYMLYYDIIPVDINEAVKYYKMAINRGSANAMYCYGHTLAIGNHVPINKKEAIKYYKMAIEKGQQEAMIDYADMLIDGNGIQQNQEEGIKYYKMAIDKGNGKAMNDLGQRYGRGVGMPINYVEAAKYFKMSADAGYSLGIANYGFMLQNGKGIQMNKQEAIKYYKLAIDKNESVAMFSYAKMLKNGEGISQNIKEAIKYFKMSINYGYASAMATYGEMLENGDCVQVDIDKAIKYYKMAIEKGNPLGMFKYANLLKTGKGVSKNIDEAIKYYKLAIKNGSDKAMNAFGYMLEIGDGIQMNKEEAIKYYKMAIDKGNPESMRNYARLLENGDGIPMNKEEAIKYYKMAADKEEGNKYQ